MSQTTTTIQEKKYPEKKKIMYEELQKLPTQYNIVALSKMSKVRATQLMSIRKKFKNEIIIKVIKNKIAIKAFENVKNVQGIEELSKELEGQCALMFTNINPFKLNLIFSKNKVFLPAKGGDVTNKEIIIPAGNTGINPGPVLSEFKEANVPTKIDQGTIAVTRDTVVAKPGTEISQKLASLLSKLNVKPIEAGIAVNYAISEGLQFSEKDLFIDLEEYQTEIQRSASEAFAFATEIGYMTEETIKPILAAAHNKALNLALESGYTSKDTIEGVLQRAHNKAQNISHKIKEKGYDTV